MCTSFVIRLVLRYSLENKVDCLAKLWGFMVNRASGHIHPGHALSSDDLCHVKQPYQLPYFQRSRVFWLFRHGLSPSHVRTFLSTVITWLRDSHHCTKNRTLRMWRWSWPQGHSKSWSSMTKHSPTHTPIFYEPHTRTSRVIGHS